MIVGMEGALDALKWTSLTDRWLIQRAVMMFKVANGLIPEYLSRGSTKRDEHYSEGGRVTRGMDQGNFRPCPSGTDWGRRRLAYHGAHLWNSLPSDVKICRRIDSFRSSVTYLVRNDFKFYHLKTS